MTDDATTTPPLIPSPTDPNIVIDAEHVLHDAERDTRHGLSHLEDEFVAEWHKLVTFSVTEAKKLLAWVASKLPEQTNV